MSFLEAFLEDFYAEDIEKHNELNPKLFEDNQLKPEVLEKISEIVEAFMTQLESSDIELDLTDIILVGSNVSYNYTANSDLDIHLIADMSKYESNADLDKAMTALYDAQKRLFNHSISINFYGIPVSIYVETNDTKLRSNGVYSVMFDKWIKEPVLEDIPDVDMEAVEAELQPYLDRFNQIKENPDTADILELIDDIYDVRQQGMTDPLGEYSVPNLVFKEFRNKGCLDELKTMRDELLGQTLSLGEDPAESEAPIDEALISNKDREKYRIILWRTAHTQPIIQDNGLFNIYNIDEQSYRTIVRNLENLDEVEYVSASPSGKYNFGKLDFRMGTPLPTKYYTITGKLKI